MPNGLFMLFCNIFRDLDKWNWNMDHYTYVLDLITLLISSPIPFPVTNIVPDIFLILHNLC